MAFAGDNRQKNTILGTFANFNEATVLASLYGVGEHSEHDDGGPRVPSP